MKDFQKIQSALRSVFGEPPPTEAEKKMNAVRSMQLPVREDTAGEAKPMNLKRLAILRAPAI
jgi:hypothetical protein